ncbi:MAG: hypothetical protein V2I46_04035 [Bacteroides sp.]|jgi:hypothetical protein|nr:hypothetical protein [Bacteroides sp.]
MHNKKMHHFGKQAVIFFLVLAGLLIVMPSKGQAAWYGPETVTIVVKDRSQNPLEGALVFVNDSTDLAGITDEQGMLEYSLESGTYMLFAYLPDHRDHYSMFTVEDAELELEVVLAPALLWATEPTGPPQGVGSANGVRLAEAGGKIYLHMAVGGVPGMPTAGALTDFYVYDPEADEWAALPNAPFGGQYGISTAYGPGPEGQDAVYIIRGYWSGQRTWLARYIVDNGQWETDLSYEIPWRPELGSPLDGGSSFQDYPRNGAVMAWDGDDHIYLFPGSGYSYLAYDWYRYSVSQDSWEALDALPHMQGPGNAAIWVDDEAAGLDQDYLYVHFGLVPHGNYTHAEFWRYGLVSESWEQMASHGYGADDGSMLAWDGERYLYHIPGAWEEDPWDRNVDQKREFMRYDLVTDAWSHMEYSPYNRWGGWDDGGGMVRVEQSIFALKGGSDVSWAIGDNIAGGGSVPSNQFWRFAIPEETLDLTISVTEGSGRIFPPEGGHALLPDTELQLMATPDSGYVFHSWRLDGQPFGNEATTTLVVRQGTLVEALFADENTFVPHIPALEPLQAYHAHGTLHLSKLPAEGTLMVFDALGRVAASWETPAPGDHSFRFSPPAGMYVIRFVSKKPVSPVKILVY